jgi:hypothetical protein
VLSVLRANSMAVLRDFPRDKIRFGQRCDQVAYKLRLANASRVAAHDD